MRLNYAIVFVSDMSRSVAFYRDVLGLPPQEPRTVFGSRIAQYADPDGLAISVGEERGGGTHERQGGGR